MQTNNIETDIVTPIKKREAIRVGKLRHEIGKKWTDEEILALADEFFDWYEGDDNQVWFKSYFTRLKISRATIDRLRSRSTYFDEVYLLAKDIQEERLVNLGLEGKKNIGFVIFTMKNCLGWSSEPKADPMDEDIQVLIDDWPRDADGNPIMDQEELSKL